MRRLLFVSFLCVACGARTDIPEGEETDASVHDDVVVEDSTVPDVPVIDSPIIDVPVIDVPVVDSPVVDVIEIDTGTQCIQDCTHNHQCEQTCPPLQQGRWCCDEQVGMCYAFAGKHCPQIIPDAGFD